ncbi:hypothetical protein [Kordiimonas marina]|uniref:hypothetical protein n=1 Tax=Kordiimonas marina TaxID=2872312 RepID=UPI001FF5D657|nr:hypothetical protein [Kordiimonas marina]MCJ9428553.1 hypothetical protein [Kordiimonas marina]
MTTKKKTGAQSQVKAAEKAAATTPADQTSTDDQTPDTEGTAPAAPEDTVKDVAPAGDAGQAEDKAAALVAVLGKKKICDRLDKDKVGERAVTAADIMSHRETAPGVFSVVLADGSKHTVAVEL